MSPPRGSALAVGLLCSRLIESAAKPLSAGEVWALVEAGQDPGDLLEALPEGLPGKLTADRLQARLGTARAWGLIVDQLAQQGISVVTAFDEGYPEHLRDRLGSAAPALLYVAGAPSLLANPGVGIVGSRDPSPEAVAGAAAVAREAVALGLPVVSGAARGIDRTAMGAALEADGVVVGFPAEPLERLIRDAATRRAVLDERAVLATPYNPAARFTVGNAMGRNKLIYAHSTVTVVMAADHGRGGTWTGAVEALDKHYGPVAVWTGPGAGPGNTALVKRGAVPLDAPEALASAVEQPPAKPDGDKRSAPVQLDMAL